MFFVLSKNVFSNMASILPRSRVSLFFCPFSRYADDMLIKLWDWDNKWTCAQVFEGHSHYVMQIVFNPKDNNTFASASLDRSVKVRKFLPGYVSNAFIDREPAVPWSQLLSINICLIK